MKRLLFWTLVFLGPLTETKAGRVVVYGQATHFEGSSLDFSYEQYKLLQSQKVQKVEVDKAGSFSFTVETDVPLKGFFMFGKVPVTYTFTFPLADGRDSTADFSTFDPRLVFLYMEPGDTVHMKVDINDVEKTLRFSGSTAGNNIFVNEEEWILNSYKERFLRNYYEPFSRLPAGYVKVVEKRLAWKMSFLDSMSARYQLSRALKDVYYWKFYAESVTSRLYYPGNRENYTNKPVKLPAGYFDFLKEVKLADEGANKGIGYNFFLDAVMRKRYELFERGKHSFADFVKRELPEKAAYEYLAYALGKNFTPEILDMFGPDCPYPGIAAAVKEKYRHLQGMMPGSAAPVVRFLTPDGRPFSFGDFKGKYLYIDFWATWCGPCIKEIPSLVKLEKEFQGREITFLSISFDKDADEQKWKDYVKDHQMTSRQFRADAKSHELLTRNWNISMIPRFVILDKEGRVVNVNAPFPSDKKIRTALNKLPGL